MMTESPLPELATLDAWLDGESVPHTDVLAMLATDAGRAYVVDLMALRRACRSDVLVPQPARSTRWRWLAAAAALVLTTTGGFLVGQRAPATAAPDPAAVTGTASSSAPAPTRVIQFEVGVDWRDVAGGD
jgi:hypothetical protein